MKRQHRITSVLLSLVIILTLTVPAWAGSSTFQYLYGAVSAPECGSVGGEWTVIALARSGESFPDEYFLAYYQRLEAYVKKCSGVLSDRRYTEYSRVALALTAMGKNPENVAGYNLLQPLGDYDKTILQGLNGAIFALIALDSGDYEMPVNTAAKTQATRQMYVDKILDSQLSDGGWALTGSDADADITAMALAALAEYKNQPKVQRAITAGIECLSETQDDDGGYTSWGTKSCESCAQVLEAMCALGIETEDSRFVKNGKTVLDALMSFRESDGSFRHTDGKTGSDIMATEQAALALAALARQSGGKATVYDMADDHLNIGASEKSDFGLSGRHADIRLMPITDAGRTFPDIAGSEYKEAVEALAERGIINGKSTGLFDPGADMTRAEFAAIITRALGLTARYNGAFSDVAESAWYGGYIGTANTYGIVNGTGGGKFTPLGTITRQEAAAMVARAAKLCGMDTAMTTTEIRDTLSQFGDYVSIASWARESMAFCYASGILSDEELNTEPTRAILRGEIAQMLYNMLTAAELV